jgi:hypothetical protein
MALTDLKLPKITYKKAAHYTQGRSEPVRAFVNHRMVGYLAGTDAYFQNPETRNVSTHFGIGYGADGVVKISQYVPLDDTAYGNGNYDSSGSWDNWGFKTTELNAQTISIEHQDHGDPKGKGIVSLKTQEASMKLQALLRYGTLAQWKAAGIIVRDWANNGPILIKEISNIVVDGRHIVTHNDISGRLKPYCWKPWSSDTVGFPRTTYVSGIKKYGDLLKNGPAPVPAPTPTPTPTPPTYTQAQLDLAVATAVKTAVDPLNAKVKLLQDQNFAHVREILYLKQRRDALKEGITELLETP